MRIGVAAVADDGVHLDQNDRRLRADEELLRLETHHRLMNTFSIMASTLQREMRAPEPCGCVALDRSARMILAHSRLHWCLMLGSGGGAIHAGEYVTELCLRLTDAILEPIGVRCEVSTVGSLMERRRCERLGLVLCEIVLNAAKHAFPDLDEGLVRVTLSRNETVWTCRVTGNGVGFNGRPANGGLGGQLIGALIQRLGGRVSVRSSTTGTSVAILLPAMESASAWGGGFEPGERPNVVAPGGHAATARERRL